MNTKVKALKEKLCEKNIKPTLIRLRIFKFMEENPIHPGADTVYRALKDELPVLSKASVYNALNLFAERGLIMKINPSAEKINFDGNTNPHFHFLCKKCGKVYDLNIDSPFFKKRSIEKHRVKEFHGYFKGECRRCRK